MRITGSYTQSYCRNTQQSQTSSKCFADLLGSQSKANKSAGRANSVPTPAQQDFDPMSAYEQMTGQAQSTSRNIRGVNWSDKTLAVFIGNGGNIPIDTTKTINWGATGEAQLTDEQIAGLNEKYDMGNLSAQNFYDLMSDLTNMNVLSAEDCAGMHLATASSGAGLSPGGSQFAGRQSGFMSENLMKGLSDTINSMLQNLDWLGFDKYDEANPYGAKTKDIYKLGIERDIQTRQNVLQLLQQIQRAK